MTWTVVLDPYAIASGPPGNRTQLDLNNGPIQVDQKGIDWGDSQVQVYMADRRVGSTKIDFRMPNRKVTIPLFLMTDDAPGGTGLTEEQGRQMLREKVGLLQMSGGWLMRQRAGGPATYADVIDAILTLPDVWGETGAVESNIALILECSPDFYGDEITLPQLSATGAMETLLPGPGQTGNLLSNPNFEADTVGGTTVSGWLSSGSVFWITGGSSFLVLADNDNHTPGSKALQITSGPPTTGAEIPISGTFLAGQTYTFSIYAKAPAGGISINLAFGCFSPSDRAMNSTLTLTSAWQRFWVTWTPSANRASNVSAAVQINGSSGNVIEIDSAMVTTDPAPVTYYDSNSSVGLILGDHQGRASIVVNNTSGVDQIGLLWAFRWTFYDGTLTSKLIYEAEDLNPVSPAAAATVASTNGVQHSSVGTVWTPVLATDVNGTTPMTHLGSYRIRARVYTTTATTTTTGVWLRLVWGVGPAVGLTANPMVHIPGASNFYIVDLGEVRSDFAPLGTARWEGQIQAQASSPGSEVFIDQIYLQPLDDAAGFATANPSVQALSSPAARDNFTTETTGNLNGQAADFGGNWLEPTAGGGYIQADGANDRCTRAVTDSGAHFALTGPSVGPVDISCNVAGSAYNPGGPGLLLRYVDANNYAAAYVSYNPGASNVVYVLEKVVGGIPTTLVSSTVAGVLFPTFLTLRVTVQANGAYVFYVNGASVGSGTDATLSSVGALSTGRLGMFDLAATGTVITRYWDNFIATPIEGTDAVVYGHSSAALRYDGMFRADPTGTYFGPMASVVGDLPRVPPSGIEQRPVELFLLLTPGDLATLPDSSRNSFTAQIKYRPVYLHRQ